MLNRRILRVKAMQSIYAFLKSQESNYYLQIDQIKEIFRDELNLLGVEEHKERVSGEQEHAIAVFTDHYHPYKPVAVSEKVSEKTAKIVNEAILVFKNKREAEIRESRLEMLKEVEQIHTIYLDILHLLVRLAEFAEKAKLDPSMIKVAENLSTNKVVAALKTNEKLDATVDKWELETIAPWFKLMLKTGSVVEALKNEDRSIANDKQALRVIVRDFLMKNDAPNSYFDEQTLNWSENQGIVKSMVIKTIKDIDEEEDETSVSLLLLSRNWEDDKSFFIKIYNEAIENWEEYERFIAPELKRWSVDRIAHTDMILLKLALAEMINCPSIPIKVTINEFIEVSKQYSTPKSSQFINGMLDTISEKLMATGEIKKSGRGLIDNQ